jgi:hypothetical protein
MTYTCVGCGKEFVSDWSDEKVQAEYEANFGLPFDPQNVAVLCDECYDAMISSPNEASRSSEHDCRAHRCG